MSRSYKKFPVCKDHRHNAKKFANRRVRRALKQNLDLVLKHHDYKKYTESWEIHD